MPKNSLTSIVITERDIIIAINNMNVNSSLGVEIFPKYVNIVFPYLVKPLHRVKNSVFDFDIRRFCVRRAFT